jgi:hypothetical protein
LEEATTPGEAKLLVYGYGDCLIAFPVLLRTIDGHSNKNGSLAWRDITSVYGYAGPVASCVPVPEETKKGWRLFLESFFQEHGVVCAFARLHPLLEQTELLSDYGQVVEAGPTLSIDLSLPEEVQWSAYRRNQRSDIARLGKRGVTCTLSGVDRLDDFIAIYYENMDRVGAPARHYYSKSYLESLLADTPGGARLFICEHEGKPIAGGVFTLCNGIVQWHLSGSRAPSGMPPPTKLVLDVARRWAKEAGAHTLHLGGGVGCRRDSLYHFKRGFTSREHVFATWRHVVSEDLYMQLTDRARARDGTELRGDFFPAYRRPSPPNAREARRDSLVDRREEEEPRATAAGRGLRSG